jgi:Zn-dependent protease/CBS domain-containing protein
VFPRALRIARVVGIDIRVDPSWLIIAGLVVWTFFSRFRAGDDGVALALAMAVTGALLFFASVLAHELGHALEARHRDIEVSGITLFLFGGVTEMHLEAERPVDELVIAGVGPYVSLVTAAVFGLVAAYVPLFGLAALRPVADVAGLLGWLNVGLAVFNLLPGAPLDGGRVFRALTWAVTKDRLRAIRITARTGQLLAVALGLLGVRAILVTPGALFDGLWFGLIGWFMWSAARSELRYAETERLLHGRSVSDLATVAPPRLPASPPLNQVLATMAATPVFEVFPVIDADDEVVGVLHLDDVMAVDPHDRGFRTVAELMRPVAQLAVVSPDTTLRDLIRALEQHPVVVVVPDRDGAPGDPDDVTTILSTRQVGAALERLHELTRGRARRTETVARTSR